MPACAIDDAFTPVWHACFALRFGVRLKQFKQFFLAHVLNHSFWLWTERGFRLGFVVDLVEEHVGLGGSQFSESILERLCSAHASQRNVVTLEFGSPCSTRSALFAHDLNRHGLQRVAPIHHEVFRLQRWILCFHDKNVFGNHLAHFLCLFQQRVIMCQFNVETLTVVRWKCVGFTRFHNGLPRSIGRNSFFVKRIYIDLLGTGRFSSILHGSRVSSNNGLPRSIGSNNGLPRSITTWVWNWLARWELPDGCTTCPSGRWACSEPDSFPIVFQGDLWWRPRWHVYFFVYDFSSFHPNNFRNTVSWKCFMKNDGVRSSLIELQSFLQSKIDVVPIHRNLMSFPWFMHVLCMTRYT